MASLQDIERRISSTKKTVQITSAMQMVSTSKLSQIQKMSLGYSEYVNRLEAVVAHLASGHLLDGVDSSNIPLIAQRPISKVGILIITSDRGLVGSYNANVIKETLSLLKELNLNKEDVQILAVGVNGAEFFKKQGYNVAYEYTGVSDVPTYNEIRNIVRTVTSMYQEKVFDSLHVVYNHYVNRITNEFKSVQLLPLTANTLDVMGANPEDRSDIEVTSVYEVEPDETEILNSILPQYAQTLVYEAVVDAKTAEHAASANAMRSATDNANDLISRLTLQYNRARQAAITTEITEITGGMAALD